MATGSVGSWVDEVQIGQAMSHTAGIARWVRLSGTEDERKAFDYVADILQGYGLKTIIHEPTCLVSLPLSGSIQVAADDPIVGITHAYAVSTGPVGIAGELVYAGHGTEADLRTAGATGKVALTEGLATPDKALAATRAGVRAVVCISGTPVHEMIVSPIWGAPTTDSLSMMPDVAMVSIENEPGERLKALLEERGPQRCRVVTEVDTGWRPIPVLIADLDIDDRDYVMFSGHIDSWHYGAMDNATANATMIETARILAGHREDLARGVRFCFWSGHSHARYAGSTWFADRYWFDLREHCVAHVNVDSTGAIGATDLTQANTMAESYGFARDVIQRHTGQELVYKRFGRAGDQSFWGIGLPAMFMSLSQQGEADAVSEAQAFLFGGSGSARAGGLGWWWHTTEDTMDKVDPNHLERDIRVYVETVGHLATTTILPFDLTAVVAEIAAALSEIEPLWADLPGSGDDAAGFATLRNDLRALELAAAGLNERIQNQDGDGPTLNSQLIEACKLLMPLNYTVCGEFEHDPALNSPAVPSLRPSKPVVSMSDNEYWGASHKLRRDINRARAAIRAATATIEAS